LLFILYLITKYVINLGDVTFDENDLTNKTTSLRNILNRYELRLRGYRTSNSLKHFYTGDVLCGNETIKNIVLFLESFSENVNLITNKREANFIDQIYYTFRSYLRMTVNSFEIPSKNIRVLHESFWNTLLNICDVISESKSMMEKLFKMKEEGIPDNLTA